MLQGAADEERKISRDNLYIRQNGSRGCFSRLQRLPPSSGICSGVEATTRLKLLASANEDCINVLGSSLSLGSVARWVQPLMVGFGYEKYY